MNIVYLLRRDINETLAKIIKEQEKDNQVKRIDLNDTTEYEEILDQIEKCDRVISW